MSAAVHADPKSLTAVTEAWKQALQTEQCDFTQSWEEAGGDSLATLHLLLLIERALGRKLTFDMLRPEMHASDLVALLRDEPLTPTDGRPLVHLLPGLFGDEPRLARFRRVLAGRISFNVVPVPNLRQSAAILGDTVRTAALAASEIQARQPAGAIMLAGYSFGGCVACETARALAAAGREIALLAVLDAPFGRSAEGSKRTLRQRLGPKTISLVVTRWMCSWNAGRRACLSQLERIGLAAEIAVKQYVYLAFVDHAMNRWSPATLEVDTWLAISAQYAPKTMAIWQRLCPRLRVVHIPGAHLDIFQSPALEVLIPAFAEAVRTTQSRMQSATGGDDSLPPVVRQKALVVSSEDVSG
jgi:thioesterase domain-containing protein